VFSFRKEGNPMSKKSKPGDGSYGRGVKGGRPAYEPLFEVKKGDMPEREPDADVSCPPALEEDDDRVK
jgi:hypothetical protein